MASIRIPKEDLPILKKISELDESQFSSLISALGETDATLTPKRFIQNISKKLTTIQRSELEDVLRVTFVLYWMKERLKESSKELAESVCKSVAESASKDCQLPSAKLKLLSNRLQKLLDFNSVAVTSKALDVMTEHQRVFCKARILSDIRPVFAGSLESASAAVIIHNLQIGFHDSGTGKHEEFYVSLDTSDIQILKKVIERAEKKTVALQSIRNKSSIPYLEV